jgi:hypothetical protein
MSKLKTYEDIESGGPPVFEWEDLLEQIKIRDTYINSLRNEICMLVTESAIISIINGEAALALCKKTVYEFEIDDETRKYLEDNND